MSQNDKQQLLLKDLCARLPYGVICKVEFKDSEGWKTQNMSLKGVFINECYFTSDTGSICSKEFKPYLRPMSSMTEEEKKEYKHLVAFSGSSTGSAKFVDWLNAHYFDYRGLIPMGLALEAPENMYKL